MGGERCGADSNANFGPALPLRQRLINDADPIGELLAVQERVCSSLEEVIPKGSSQILEQSLQNTHPHACGRVATGVVPDSALALADQTIPPSKSN